jgi:hypothetical protein
MSFLTTQRWAFALLIVGALCIGGYAVLIQARQTDILAACATDSNKPLCYSREIENILRAEGIPEAFDALAVVYDNDREFAGTCHALTHELGKAAYEEFHKTGHTELTSKASYCGYGFYHGFLDQLLIDTNDLAEARAFCTYVGQNVPHPPEPEFAEGSCYHGIGHGITDGTDPRLWGDELRIAKPGLVLCERVAGGNDTWQSRCASGVFNAIGNMYNDPKYKLATDPDPYAFCREGKFSAVDTDACYNQMNTQAAQLGEGKLPNIIQYALAIKNEHHRLVALKEAVSFYVQILKWDQKDVSVTDMNVCALSARNATEGCVRGLIGGVYEFGSPGRQYQEALAVCSHGELNDNLRGLCYDEVIQLAGYFYKPELVTRICSEIPNEYARACMV